MTNIINVYEKSNANIVKINDKLGSNAKQKKTLYRDAILQAYIFASHCFKFPSSVKKLENYPKAREGTNPFHDPVNYLIGGKDNFFPCDLTHFSTIFDDAYKRHISVTIFIKKYDEYGSAVNWYKAIKGKEKFDHNTKEKLKANLSHVNNNHVNATNLDIKLLSGDSAEVLKDYPDNYFDSIITDPPYGINIQDWDSLDIVEPVWNAVFKECYRVLKPNGSLLAFCAPRTYHKMVTVLENHCFEIKDMIIRCYMTGYPKSKDILKPAHEPIVWAVKSSNEESAKLNIDSCRVPYQGNENIRYLNNRAHTSHNNNQPKKVDGHPEGRWPTNIIGELPEPYQDYQKFFISPRTEKWERHTGFDSLPKPSGRKNGELFDKNQDSPLSASGKQKWIDSKGNPLFNNHPCVKSIDLMSYLIKLATPKNGKVLDPFMGSGSTGLGCISLGMDFVGIEIEELYVKVAKIRTEYLISLTNEIAEQSRYIKQLHKDCKWDSRGIDHQQVEDAFFQLENNIPLNKTKLGEFQENDLRHPNNPYHDFDLIQLYGFCIDMKVVTKYTPLEDIDYGYRNIRVA